MFTNTYIGQRHVLKYIVRYLGRPVIATSHLDNYGGENVTFHYHRHEDEQLVTTTVSAIEFIKMLIIHIPDNHFKMIRYYGLYAKHHKHESKLSLAVSKQKRRLLASALAWRSSLLSSFGYDPLLFKCGHIMTIFEICLKGSPLIEFYRKISDSS